MGKIWRLSALLVATLALISPVSAQIPGGGGITAQGAVVTGNCVKWISSTVAADSGGPCGGTGSPGGTANQVQFNSAGSFGGFTFGGDATLVVGTGILTVTKTNGTAFGSLATATPGAGVLTAIGVALSGAGGITSTIASGTAALGTSAISSGACATVVTVAATNVATTDTVMFGYNSDPTAVTGYGASATGAVLTIYPYPTSGNVNVKVCNSSQASITPSAITLNWRVVR
jgi:hypothetical protein